MLLQKQNIKYKIFSVAILMMLIAMVLAPVYQTQAYHDKKSIVPCGTNAHPADCTLGHFIVLISNIIFFLIENIALPVAVISFAWAGWLYLTAGGNPGQIEKAHTIFKYVLIGLLLALGAWLIVNGILSALGVGDGQNGRSSDFNLLD